MRRTLIVMALLAVTTLVGAIAFQTTARERDYRALLGRGDTALAAAAAADAIERYSGALALRPDSMVAHLRRGEAYLLRGELDDAARDFRQAAQLDPAATRPLELWGEVLYRQERYRRAAEVLETRLQLDERSAPTHYRQALAHFRDGHPDLALAAATEALRLDDRLADALYLTALCYREQGRLKEAIDALERTVARAPGDIEAREDLADLYDRVGRANDYVQQLQALAALDGDHVERRVAVGLAHARFGRTDLAVLTLANVLEDNPDQMPVWAALGGLWLDIAETRADRPDALAKALDALGRAASAASATSETKALYGKALLQDGQTEAAERMLQQATERFPTDPRAYALYADAAEQQQHFEAARTALISYGALLADPAPGAARSLRIAQLSRRAGDPAAAITWFERAAAAAPRDVTPLLGLVDACLAAQDHAGAEAALERARAVAPDDPQVARLARQVSQARAIAAAAATAGAVAPAR